MAKDKLTISQADRNVLRQIGIRRTPPNYQTGTRKIASPDVRKYAAEKGLSIDEIAGHGENGSVTKADVDRYIEQLKIFERIQAQRKEREKKEAEKRIQNRVVFELDGLSEKNEVTSSVDSSEICENAGISEEEYKMDTSSSEDISEEIKSENPVEETVNNVSETDFSAYDEPVVDNHQEPIQEDECVEEEGMITAEMSLNEKDHSTEQYEETEDTVSEVVFEKEKPCVLESDTLSFNTVTTTADDSVFDPVTEKINEELIRETIDYDVVIIGCGMSGYETAVYAANAGLKTAIIEKDEVGGKTLKDGVFPMAYLRKNAAFIGECGRSSRRGIIINNMSLDLQTMMRDKAKKILRYREKMVCTLKNLGIDFYNGTAKVNRNHTVSVSFDEAVEVELRSDAIIAATGTTYSIPECCAQISNIFTDGQAHDLERLPDEMVIIGSGIAACEYASFYSILGTSVSIIVSGDKLLPDFDEDVQKIAEESLAAMQVELYYRSEVKDVYRDSLGDLHIEVQGASTMTTLICTDCFVIRDKIPNTNALTDMMPLVGKNGILIDEKGQTTCEGLYAVGNVVGNGGKTAAPSEVIAAIQGKSTTDCPVVNPVCINMFPQISVIGLSEYEARKKGKKIKVNIVSADKNMRLFMDDQSQGFVKLISDEETDLILGAAACCDNAFEVIGSIQMMMAMNGTTADFARISYHQPSTVSITGEAVLI